METHQKPLEIKFAGTMFFLFVCGGVGFMRTDMCFGAAILCEHFYTQNLEGSFPCHPPEMRANQRGVTVVIHSRGRGSRRSHATVNALITTAT